MTMLDSVVKAIITMADRQGSSLPALKKAIGVDESKKHVLNKALRTGVEKGVLIKNKGRFKVSAEAKKKPAAKKKKPADGAKKKTATKAKSPTKKKKTATKAKSPTKKKKKTSSKTKSPTKKKKKTSSKSKKE